MSADKGKTAALAETEAAPTSAVVPPELASTELLIALSTSGPGVAVRVREDLARTAELAVESGESSGAPEAAVSASGDMPHLSGAERFETGGRIGSGGMGEVVLQVDKNIGRAVAKKMLHPEMHSAVSLQRFVREARVQGQLEHPAVVPVHDFGVDADGRLFFSMKRIRGQTLGQIVERLAAQNHDYEARFSRHRLLSAFVQVCLAISYAHARGVIHRDLKPSNIMLGDFGEVYVLDWGLAKLTSRTEVDELPVARPSDPRASTPDMTSDGDLLGTPLYMAPEQMLGRHAAADERADVFSLGAILFEILTLEPFRRGTSLRALLDDAETTAPVERPSERADDAPAELDELCASALAREPHARLASARALADAVERYLQGDRDLVLRRAQAAELLATARARLSAPAESRAAELVLAMREVLKALALAPGDAEAQRLLVALMLEGSTELSPEASAAFVDRDVEVRLQGLRRGMLGYVSWLCTIPLALIAGVRSWDMLVGVSLVALACAVTTAAYLRRPGRFLSSSRLPAFWLAGLSAIVVALTSAWLGPFVITPIAGCAATVMFLTHLRRRESSVILALFVCAVVLPYVAETLHLVPPAYTFRDGELVLHARMLDLPEIPTLLFLAYSSATFIGLLGYFVAQLRSKQIDAERRLFGQAWLLQRLFPAEDAASSTPPR